MTNSQSNPWQSRADSVHFETRPFIQGDYTSSTSSSSHSLFHTQNPATEETLASFPDAGSDVVDQAVSAARRAFCDWQQTTPEQRKALLLTLADKLADANETLALLDCLEMGMPISKALQKAEIAADTLRYYAESIDKVCGDLAPSGPNTLGMSIPEPRGVVGVIAPWNSPMVVALSAIAPALAAGNTVVLKPSEQTPSSALKLAEIMTEAGLPAGVLNVVPGLGISAGAALASHPDVDLLHFTGSTQTGRQLMQYAGQSNGKPLLLELGGKSPQLVFDDALDLPNLGAVLAQSAFANSGQICVAKTRLLVHENSKEQLIEQIKQHTKTQFQIGNPLDEATTFGPIASQKQRERVEHFLNLGEKEGAIKHSLAVAGERPSRGHFLPPTLFDQVDNRMQIAQAEIFGPVLAVVTFKTDDEAIRLANDVNYGLSASAWTKDLARARRLARELKAGSVTICSTTAQSGSASGLSNEPFGASGFGVVGGVRGLAPFTRLKAVQIVTD